MADVAIVSRATVAAPKDYDLSAGELLELKAVRAVIDGTGAAAAFLPALQLVAPDGTVMWTAVPRDAVAAGGSADVSWFPDVEQGAATTPDVDTAGTVALIQSPGGTLSVSSPTGPTTSIDMPATGVVAGSYGDASDSAQVTVDAEGRITAATSVPIAGGGSVVASDGWVPDTTETWTYASFSAGPPALGTFTVPGDLRAKYTVGTRIKLVQTTTRYFVVVADPTYDGVKTTVSVSAGTDYTLANAAISGNYHSYVGSPQGYPGWFNFAPAFAGWASFTTSFAQFGIGGDRVLFLEVRAVGTSNATSAAMTLPVAPSASRSPFPVIVGNGADNGGVSAAISLVMTAGSTASNFRLGYASNTSWTASGTKTCNAQGVYGV